MKKGLSILLVAAALFGFYGSAVNLNDVLACKDYWEKAGEESTANMNKLEDGLNQLKENEQAYLDGKEQVADGEVALAEGEQTLADGEAQYAKGLKSYKEAPAKLAAGKAKLAEGKKSYGNLKKLINGLETAKKHGTTQTKAHDTYWHDAYTNALVPGKQLIVKTLNEKKSMVGMLEMLTGASDLVSKAANAKSVEAFDGVVTKELKPTFEAAAKQLTAFAGIADEKSKSLSDGAALHNKIRQAEAGVAKQYGKEAGDTFPTGEQLLAAAGMDGSPFAGLKPYLQGIKAQAGDAAFGAYAASKLVRMSAAAQNAEFLGTKEGQMLQGLAAQADGSGGLNDQVAAIVGGMKMIANDGKEGGTSAASFETVAGKVSGGLSDASDLLKEYAATAQGSADQFQQWDDGYQTLAHAKDGEVSKKYPDDLASKSSGIPYAFQNIVSNSTTKAAVKAYDKSLMSILKKYDGNKLKNDSMEQFDKDIVYLSTKVIP
jgi:putative membrane protein